MDQPIEKTALLVMDMQAALLGAYPGITSLVPRVAQAIVFARSRNIPVIYVVVGFRPGTPEISPVNKGLAAAKARFANIDMDAWVTIHSDLAPKTGEIIVTKRRVSAFTGSDLEVLLRAQGIQHIVLTGLSTSGVVLSTVREAADKDYRITVLSDGCADPDLETHTVLTTKVFPRQADVLTVGAWTAQHAG